MNQSILHRFARSPPERVASFAVDDTPVAVERVSARSLPMKDLPALINMPCELERSRGGSGGRGGLTPFSLNQESRGWGERRLWTPEQAFHFHSLLISFCKIGVCYREWKETVSINNSQFSELKWLGVLLGVLTLNAAGAGSSLLIDFQHIDDHRPNLLPKQRN